jgi:ribose transport system substrate-binding protein
MSYFKAQLAAEEAVPTYHGPTSGPKPQAGKHVFTIVCAATNPGCVQMGTAIKESDDAVGWKTTIMDGKGSPSVTNQDMITAVNSGADAIVLDAIDSRTVVQGMEAARKAHVVVGSNASDNVVGKGLTNVAFEVSAATRPSGKSLADYFVVSSNGHAQVASLHVSTIPGTQHRYEAFMKEFKMCAGCKVVSDQTYGLVSQSDFTSLIKATVAAHPDIQYIFLDISQYATIAGNALGQLGLAQKIHVAGIDCLPPEIESIKLNKGEVACSYDQLEQSGWATTNELTRYWAGLKPLPTIEDQVPVRLLTKSIIPNCNPNTTGCRASFMGTFTLKPYYLKLWGIK